MLNYFLACQEFFEEGDEIWFSAYSHNGLYKVNKKTKSIELMCRFPGEKGYIPRLYKAAAHTGDRLVFAPCAADEIAIYHYKQNQIKKIVLNKMPGNYQEKKTEDFKFWTAIPYKNYVYLFGHRYPAIIRLEAETGEVVYHTEWLEGAGFEDEGKNLVYWMEGAVRGAYAYLPCIWTSAVMEFNLETAGIRMIKIDSQAKGFYRIADDGKSFWLAPRECLGIVKWNPDSDDVKEIGLSQASDAVYPFYRPLITERKIYLFPFGIKDVYSVDLETETIERDKELSEVLNINKKDYTDHFSISLNPIIVGQNLVFIRGRDYAWCTYHLKTGEKHIDYLEVRGKERENIEQLYIDEMVSDGNILAEDREGSLQTFFKYLDGKHFADLADARDGAAGARIHKEIMRETDR